MTTNTDRDLRVFISYSRKDEAFANDLLHALTACKFEPYLDQQDIVPGEPWEERLDILIRKADSVVFVISPQSVVSKHCEWEVKKAIDLGKRLMPVVAQVVDNDSVPNILKRLNYVFFTGEKHSFALGLRQLVETLRSDVDWIREHTRLLELANRWQRRGQPVELLPRANELIEARNWKEQTPPDTIQLTSQQLAFIAAAEQAEEQRISDAKAHEKLLRDAELQRLKAENEASDLANDIKRRRQRLFTWLSIGTLALMLIAGGLFFRDQAKTAQLANEQANRNYQQQIAQHLQSSLNAFWILLFGGEVELNGLSPIAVSLLIQYESTTIDENGQQINHPYLDSNDNPGIIIGYGYTLAHNSAEQFKADWKSVFSTDDLEKLSKAAGLKGDAARTLYPELRNIRYSPIDAARVFLKGSLPEYRQKLEKAFPGVTALPPLCYGAMLSIVYNRGAGLKGERRREMLAIHDAIVAKNFDLIPNEIRNMKRLWENSSAAFLVPRRESEARMCELGLAETDLK